MVRGDFEGPARWINVPEPERVTVPDEPVEVPDEPVRVPEREREGVPA